jgi:protein-S-isoprenylcysteine O-methyltransferase Ste14
LGPALRASSSQRAARRRRDLTRALTASVTVTLVLAATTHAPAAWALQILVDVVGVTYVGLWAWMRTMQLERNATVRYMPERRAPELALRRSASS